MNKYLKNLNRIEFIVTYNCTGKCKHCSIGSPSDTSSYLDKDIAGKVVFEIAEKYNIQSVMTFGGEPLLNHDCVCAIHSAAEKSGIPKRQLITNGFFSQNPDKIKSVAEKLSKSGVNDILLSVDAFHQETIPKESVKLFANEIQKAGLPLRLNPAWLVSKKDCNEYNKKTAEILKEFKDMGIVESNGNIVFPEGNALKYLKEYFTDQIPENPYTENPLDLKSISIEPDGSILGKNIYKESIIEILKEYNPSKKL